MIGVLFSMSSNFMRLWPRKNGIYKITNRNTGRFYIGKASGKKGFYGRWEKHRLELRKNIHCCSYLQSSYNKHGESCFTFEILEIKEHGEQLGVLESEYIVNLEAMHFQKGYNITNKATEFPKIVREDHPTAKEFEILDPEGNLIKARNLSKFCEDFELGISCISSVLNGKVNSHKGFTSPIFHKNKREYRLLSPEKKLIVFHNIAKFAREIGVGISSIRSVLNGRKSSIKGYHLEFPSPENQKNLDRLFNKKLLLNKGVGVIISFVAIKTFCRKYKVSYTSLWNFFKGTGNLPKKNYSWSVPTEEERSLYPIIEENF